MALLALPHCLWLPYWHHQLVLSWYLHPPESHRLSQHKGQFVSGTWTHRADQGYLGPIKTVIYKRGSSLRQNLLCAFKTLALPEGGRGSTPNLVWNTFQCLMVNMPLPMQASNNHGDVCEVRSAIWTFVLAKQQLICQLVSTCKSVTKLFHPPLPAPTHDKWTLLCNFNPQAWAKKKLQHLKGSSSGK